MPVERLRWVSFSHFEADECGSLNEWLAVAPHAAPLCGRLGAMLSFADVADRAPRVLGDGETISIGQKKMRWFDTPHLPHNWEAGYFAEVTTRTLFCGDILTQPGAEHEPITQKDVLGPSEAMRKKMEYYANTKTAAGMLERFAALEPTTLACMHGAAYRGNGASVLRALASALERTESNAHVGGI
jgi:flavorubredoxin